MDGITLLLLIFFMAFCVMFKLCSWDATSQEPVAGYPVEGNIYRGSMLRASRVPVRNTPNVQCPEVNSLEDSFTYIHDEMVALEHDIHGGLPDTRRHNSQPSSPRVVNSFPIIPTTNMPTNNSHGDVMHTPITAVEQLAPASSPVNEPDTENPPPLYDYPPSYEDAIIIMDGH